MISLRYSDWPAAIEHTGMATHPFGAWMSSRRPPGFARRATPSEENPAALWAAVGLAGVELYRGQHEAAIRSFRVIGERADLDRFPALSGRVQWGLGITRARQGQLADSLQYYRQATAAFRAAGERENLGALLALTAESSHLLGQDTSAWKFRYQALRELAALPTSRRLHNLLWESADAALETGEPRVALVLQDEDVRVAHARENRRCSSKR